MKRWAEEKAFPFKYLHDESQEVARAYDAVCTPDFFGCNADLGLQYRGRLDEFEDLPRRGCQARTLRGDEASGRDRQGSRRADAVHGLLDQVEARGLSRQ